jgi:DHA1 family tetracycline resistance protein-like MFS transporter
MPATAPGPAVQRPYPVAATAFGAHSIAANLGGYTRGQHESLLALGVLLALYDGAEVLLKPVFGAVGLVSLPAGLGALAAALVICAALIAPRNRASPPAPAEVP